MENKYYLFNDNKSDKGFDFEIDISVNGGEYYEFI